MAKMGKKHAGVHAAFLELKRPLEPQKVYEAMCKLLKLGEDAIERGIGRLYKDGKLTANPGGRRKPGKGKRGARGGGGLDLDDFS